MARRKLAHLSDAAVNCKADGTPQQHSETSNEASDAPPLILAALPGGRKMSEFVGLDGKTDAIIVLRKLWHLNAREVPEFGTSVVKKCYSCGSPKRALSALKVTETEAIFV